jgi:hypothetical protein
VIASALAAGAGMLLPGARRASAIGPGSKFRFGQLVLGKDQPPRPNALRRMVWELDTRTSIETPLLYLAGDREFSLPPPAGVETLRRFLTFGGFLVIDSAEGSTDGAFDKSVRALVDALYPRPTTGLELVPADHVVYKSFYLLDRPLGRLALSPVMEGVTRSGRLVISYVQNDLGGAWARDNLGNYELACQPGGERQREIAFRMGVNLVMYALCLDYKTDQVHVPFIMRRRRWRPDDGAVVPPKKP